MILHDITWYDIKFVKDFVHLIVDPLRDIFNKSMSRGVVPTSMQVA